MESLKSIAVKFLNTLKLMRPQQFHKNLFIFLPAFFAFEILNPQIFTQAALAFLAFSLLASAAYIFNDYCDRVEDRLHPEKKNRPLASGSIPERAAFLLMGTLLVGGGVLMVLVAIQAFALIVVYFLINVAYSLKLKHVPILDVTVIASGFVIRLLVGAVVAGVPLSHWIIVMTFLLALFLALAKRRDDVLILQRTGMRTRRVIDGYNLKFLDSAMIMTASIVVLAYILWSISPEVAERLGSRDLYLSSVFVVVGVMRYMQITYVEEKSGNPSMVLLRDRFLQMVLLGWLGTLVWILYLG
jgi:decaprenyl-phosphate phosphoribosyltransferase